jgi:hypothetical protein
VWLSEEREGTTSQMMQEEEDRPRYFVDDTWYDEHSRSFRTMALERLCESCKHKLGTETQERVPTIDTRTGRVVFELRSVPFAQNPLSVIRGCCSKRRDFVIGDTPLAEAIFRVMLASGNQPMESDRLREELANYVGIGDRPQAITSSLIERVIQHDDYYGMRELKLVAE